MEFCMMPGGMPQCIALVGETLAFDTHLFHTAVSAEGEQLRFLPPCRLFV